MKRAKPSATLPAGQGHALLTAIFFEDDGGVTGFVEELLSVSAHGRNIEEARDRLTAAAEKYLRQNRAGVRQRMESYGNVTRERLMVGIERE